MASIPPLIFVIRHLEDGSVAQNGLALAMLWWVERAGAAWAMSVARGGQQKHLLRSAVFL